MCKVPADCAVVHREGSKRKNPAPIVNCAVSADCAVVQREGFNAGNATTTTTTTQVAPAQCEPGNRHRDRVAEVSIVDQEHPGIAPSINRQLIGTGSLEGCGRSDFELRTAKVDRARHRRVEGDGVVSLSGHTFVRPQSTGGVGIGGDEGFAQSTCAIVGYAIGRAIDHDVSGVETSPMVGPNIAIGFTDNTALIRHWTPVTGTDRRAVAQ